MSGGHTEPIHDIGSELGSWPGHRMQVAPPQSLLPHIVFLVQRRQGSSPVLSIMSGPGSVMFVCWQFGDAFGLMTMSRQLFASFGVWHTVQQPKQSQPGVVSGEQTSMHCCGTGVMPHGW